MAHGWRQLLFGHSKFVYLILPVDSFLSLVHIAVWWTKLHGEGPYPWHRRACSVCNQRGRFPMLTGIDSPHHLQRVQPANVAAGSFAFTAHTGVGALQCGTDFGTARQQWSRPRVLGMTTRPTNHWVVLTALCI
jgi:hypothetical protein